MIIAGKRVLMTGSQGFTGRYMAADLIAQGCEVVGMGSQPSSQPDYYQIDLLDPASLNQMLRLVRPDIVVHLAAVAFVGHGNADAFYQVNLIGTRKLLEAIERSGKRPDCVLLASSANVYGNGSAGRLTEDAPLCPANDYAVSKCAMEFMARLWFERLPIVIARPFNYTGIGQAENFLLPKIVSHFRRKAASIELGNLDVWRDFSDVRALVAAYRGLLEVHPAGQVVNICSGETHSLREILDLCRTITGSEMRVEVNPAFVRQNEVRSLCGDNSRLKALVSDWRTPPLRETLEWMLNSPD